MLGLERQPATGSIAPDLVRLICTSLFAALLTCFPAHAADVIQTYFVPFPENDVQASLNAIDNYAGNVGTDMRSICSIVVSMDGTLIYYDQWEDGYESDITSPTQSTTQVWGDLNPNNGIPPGFGTDDLDAGDVINLETTIDVTRNEIQVEYDGGDKFACTRTVAMNRAMYAILPGEVLAGSAQAFDTTQYGLVYRAPFGVDTNPGGETNNIGEYTALFVMAGYDYTLVEIDIDNDGTVDETVRLDQGQGYHVNGGVHEGATVTASKPIQCHLLTGDIGSNYEMRWFTLWPQYQWGDEYNTPVGGRLSGATEYPSFVYFFNPNASAIAVHYETQSSTGVVSVAADSTSAPLPMPVDSGGHFYTTNGDLFLPVQIVDAALGGGMQTYDWGLGLPPRETLTSAAILGWGPGHGTTGPGTNGNPVWVTASGPTTIYADYDSDPATGPYVDPLGNRFDASNVVGALQSVRFFDRNDQDQTGMRVYTLDGTYITAAWGEDPEPAGTGNPYLDMGNIILPFPTLFAVKRGTLFIDVNTNGVPNPGDSIKFTVEIRNTGFATANNVMLEDNGSTNTTVYATNTTVLNGAPLWDDVAPPAATPFPLDEGGANIGSIQIGGTATVSYITTIIDPWPTNIVDTCVYNGVSVVGTGGQWSTFGGDCVGLDGLALAKETSTTNLSSAGDTLTYTITVLNTGNVDYTGIQLEDLLPLGVTYVPDTTRIQYPGGFTNSVYDRFNKQFFTNNNGLSKWLTPWYEDGEADGAIGGDVAVLPDTTISPSESFALQIEGENPAQNGAYRLVDLSGYTSAVYSFDYRRRSMDAGSDYVTAYVSSNGGASWTSLVDLGGDATDTAYLSANFDITPYIASNTAIGFWSSASTEAGDYLYVDNVKIAFVGDTVTNRGNPPPTLLSEYMLPAGTSMVVTLDVLVDDWLTATQYINTARVRAEQHEDWLYAYATNASDATVGVKLTKTTSTTNILSGGETLTYTITIENTGDLAQTSMDLDDLLPVGATYVAGSAELFRPFAHTNTVRDVFNYAEYGNNDGSVNWIGDWIETNDTGGASAGAMRIANDGGVVPGHVYALRVGGPNVGVQRAVDLAGYTNVTLSFEYRRANCEGGESTTLAVSTDGSAWTDLATWDGAANDAQYVATNFDLNPYISTGTWIRFLADGDLAPPDDFWYDDITITFSSTTGSTSKLDSPPDLFTDYWMPPHTSMVVTLDVTVDEPPASTQMVNTARLRSDQQSEWLYAYATNYTDATVGISLTKTSQVAVLPWEPGGTNLYTIDIRNTGTVTLSSIELTDPLPAGAAVVPGSTTIVAPGWTVTNNVLDWFNAASFSNNNGTVEWSADWIESDSVPGPLAGNVLILGGQLWMNNGSDPAGLTVSDEFDQRSYADNYGTTNWSGNWVELSDGTTDPSNGTIQIVGGELRFQELGGGDYIRRSADLTGASTATLTYDWGVAGLEENVGVWISASSSGPWTLLDTFSGGSGSGSGSHNISAYISADTTVRFGNADGGGWNYSNDQAFFDDITITFGGMIGAAREANLEGYTHALLSFDWRIGPGVDNTDSIELGVSTNGGATWTPLDVFTNIEDGIDGTASYELTPYISSATRIRFEIGHDGAYLGDSEFFAVDDLDISFWGNTGTITNTGGDPADLADGYTLKTGQVMTVTFLVTADGTETQVVNTAYADSAQTGQLQASVTDEVVIVTLGDRVWDDLNTNGIQNAGEPGVSNVTVQLLDAGSNVLAETTTATNGWYEFTGLASGDYIVRFIRPTNTAFVSADATTDDLDSDADAAGYTAVFTAEPGTNAFVLDAGLYVPPSVIGDNVWHDVDRDGIQDAGETNMPGIEVRLYDGGTNLLDSTTTDTSGAYAFVDLPPGYYVLWFGPPTDWVRSPQNQTGDTLDSDPDKLTGYTDVFYMPAGSVYTNWDAGIFPAASGLTITKTSDGGGTCWQPGDTITWTIVVENTGAVTHTQVTLTDVLPAGAGYVANSTTNVYPGTATNTLRDEFGTQSYGNSDGTVSWGPDWTESNDTSNFVYETFATTAYDNNYGSARWAGDWQETSDDGQPNGGTIQIVGAELRMQQLGNGDAIDRTVNLAGATNATFTYDWRTSGLEEAIGVYVASNAAGPFTQLTTYSGQTASGSGSHDISAYISSETTIRFANAEGAGWTASDDQAYFDEVQVVFEGTSPTPASTWSAMVTAGGEAELHYDGRALTRSADLSGAATATLSFACSELGTLEAADHAYAEISSNGTDWVQLLDLQNDFTSIASTNFDITPYASSNTAIRFRLAGYSEETEYFYLDNVQIEYVEAGGYITQTGAPPATLAQGITLAQGETLTTTFQTEVDVPGTTTQLVNTATTYSLSHQPIAASHTNCVIWTDLAVTKTVDNANPHSGDNILYTIVATNRGPNDTDNVLYEDVLPDAIQYQLHSNGNYNVGSGLWTIGSFPVGASTSLYIIGSVKVGYHDISVTNWATVHSQDLYDPVLSNNQDDAALIPTFAMVTGFRAYNAGGRTIAEWETGTELGTIGFDLLLHEPDIGAYVELNDALLPGLLTAPQGGVYRLAHEQLPTDSTAVYKLIETESTGDRRSYGPFTVTVAEATAGQQAAVQGVAAFGRTPHARPAFTEQRLAQWVQTRAGPMRPSVAAAAALPSGNTLQAAMIAAAGGSGAADRIRIGVVKNRLYHLSAFELASLFGRAPTEIWALLQDNALRLSSAGTEIAYHVGEFGLYFYGRASESVYTRENVYWLEPGQGLAMQVVDGVRPPPAPPGQFFPDTLHFEQNNYALTALFTEPESDFWLWDYLAPPWIAERVFELNVPAPAANSAAPAELTLHLKGATDAPAEPDHETSLRIGTNLLAQSEWDGKTNTSLSATFPHALLSAGINPVTVAGDLPDGAPFSVFYVDSFDLTYARRYEADADRLACVGAGHAVVTVAGFSDPSVLVLDLTDPNRPVLVHAATVDEAGGAYRASFAPAAPDTGYFLASANGVHAPASVTGIEDSVLREAGNRAHYLIVCPESLTDAAETLAEFRRAQQLEVLVVTVEEIYNAFNDGLVSPHAIRTFLQYTHANWELAPRFVLLAGNGTYDYRDNLGLGTCLLPPFMVRTPYGLHASDNRLADLDGDGMPDLAIGRLPVLTPQELAGAVAKIVSYESGGAWKQDVLLAADNPDMGGDFPLCSDAIAQHVPESYDLAKAYLPDRTVPEARAMTLAGLSNGCRLLNYLGHATRTRLAAEGLIEIDDLAGLANASNAPIVLGMSCTLGRFAVPGYDSLGSALAAKPNGGAVAVWAPVGLAWNAASAALDDALFEALFTAKRARFGEAVLDALQTRAPAGSTLVDMYSLLGDPALRLEHWSGADSDGDGLPDGIETGTGLFVDETDTGSGADNPDSDADTVLDGDELTHGTNPNSGDSDGDGFGDAREIAAGTSPIDPDNYPVSGLVVEEPPAGSWVLAGGSLQIAWQGAWPLQSVDVDLTNTVSGWPLARGLASPQTSMTWQAALPWQLRHGTDYRVAVRSVQYPNDQGLSAPFTIRARARGDFDGDGLVDPALYHPHAGMWYLLGSMHGFGATQFGWHAPQPVPADYDGDGATDVALYHAPSGMWYLLQSRQGFAAHQFGYSRTRPVHRDYDGDGEADLALFDPFTGIWYVLGSTRGFSSVQFGWHGPLPVPADYDGDRRCDPAVYDPNTDTWYLLLSTDGFALREFGAAGRPAVPVPGDYDGDGTADPALYEPARGMWYVLRSASGSVLTTQFGWSEALPVPGDYDGDGVTDMAVYHPPTGIWYFLKSSAGLDIIQFGWSEAMPVLAPTGLNR